MQSNSNTVHIVYTITTNTMPSETKSKIAVVFRNKINEILLRLALQKIERLQPVTHI